MEWEGTPLIFSINLLSWPHLFLPSLEECKKKKLNPCRVTSCLVATSGRALLLPGVEEDVFSPHNSGARRCPLFPLGPASILCVSVKFMISWRDGSINFRQKHSTTHSGDDA